jgi:hypothetical protein
MNQTEHKVSLAGINETNKQNTLVLSLLLHESVSAVKYATNRSKDGFNKDFFAWQPLLMWLVVLMTFGLVTTPPAMK